MKSISDSIDRTISDILYPFFVFVAAIIFISGFAVNAVHLVTLVGNGHDLTVVFFLFVIIALSVGVFFVQRYQTAAKIFAIILLTLVIGVRLAYMSFFDSVQTNDFATYLDCGLSFFRDSIWKCPPFIYRKRSLVFAVFIPLVSKNPIVGIKIVNFFMFLCTVVLLMTILRKRFGTLLAVFGVSICAFYPDYFYESLLCSHSNSGILWLALFYFTANAGLSHPWINGNSEKLSRDRIHWFRVWLPWFGVGFILVGLDFARSVEIPAAISLLIFSFWCGRKYRSGLNVNVSWFLRFRPVIPVLLLPVAVYCFVRPALARKFTFSEQNTVVSTALVTASAIDIDVQRSGTFSDQDRWRFRFSELVSHNREVFAAKKYVFETTEHPIEYFKYLLRKNAVLFDGTGGYLFGSRGKGGSWKYSSSEFVERTNSSERERQLIGITAVILCLFAALTLRFLFVPVIPLTALEVLSSGFSISLHLLMVFFGEVSGHYSFHYALTAAIIIPALFKLSKRQIVAKLCSRAIIRKWLVVPAIVFLFILFFYASCAKLISATNVLGFADLERAQITSTGGSLLRSSAVFEFIPTNLVALQYAANFHRVRVLTPRYGLAPYFSGFLRIEIPSVPSRPVSGLEFFLVNSSKVPKKDDDYPFSAGDIYLQITANGETVFSDYVKRNPRRFLFHDFRQLVRSDIVLEVFVDTNQFVANDNMNPLFLLEYINLLGPSK